jgi:hypothetical protein
MTKKGTKERKHQTGWFEEVKTKYHFVFLLVALVLMIFGLVNYFHQGVQISHFHSMSLGETGNTTITEAYIFGQYKTTGEGFFVGKKVSISALVYLADKQLYSSLRDMEAPKIVFVNNSEDPKDAGRDVGNAIRNGNLTGAFTNPGTLEMTFLNNTQLIVLEGDVVFTKEGDLTFGLPLDVIMQSYNLEIEGVGIAPSYERSQVGTSRLVVLLSFVAASNVFLTVFVALPRRKVPS